MLLQWVGTRDYDGSENTRYAATTTRADNMAGCSYVITPCLRDDRVWWTILESTGGLLGEKLYEKGFTVFYRSAEAAREACEKIEIEAVGHRVTAEEAIRDWAIKFKGWSFIPADKITQWITSVPPDEIRAKLAEYLAAGRLQKWYAIEGPSGSLGSGRSSGREFWREPGKIPSVLYDPGDDRFRKDDGDIIEVYRKPDGSPIATGI